MRLLDWETRVAQSIDHRAPDIAVFYGRVVPIVQGALGNIVQNLPPGALASSVRHIIDILAAK
jgi:hypothetical protein